MVMPRIKKFCSGALWSQDASTHPQSKQWINGYKIEKCSHTFYFISVSKATLWAGHHCPTAQKRTGRATVLQVTKDLYFFVLPCVWQSPLSLKLDFIFSTQILVQHLTHWWCSTSFSAKRKGTVQQQEAFQPCRAPPAAHLRGFPEQE